MRIKLSTLQKIIAEAMENAYDVLGLQPGATPREIKKAWSQLVWAARQARGGGRGGHQAAEINLYRRAHDAAMAHTLGQAENPMFEPRAVKPPPEPKAPRAPRAAAVDPMADDADNPLLDPGETLPTRKMRKAKDSYLVYHGKYGKDKARRSVVRVQGKAWGTGPDGALPDGGETIFGKGDRVAVDLTDEPDGRVRVFDPEHAEYDQTWTPVEEVRRLVDELVIESLMRKVG